MVKNKIFAGFLVLLIVFCGAGCTVNITVNNSSKIKENKETTSKNLKFIALK